ncbi:MAG: serine/threonine protein kinase [Myxococcales bacterium]|nr:serine/threonine protein kinase [Myxococcales bacterium]
MNVLVAGVVLDGRYRLERLVARGGMSEIWRARHTLLERSVALKFVRVDSDESRRLLIEEARILAAVRHPSIVEVYDCGLLEGAVPYLVMEYIDAPTLRGVLDERGTLTIDEAVAVIGALARGVHTVHERGVVHRDIKPENILYLADRAGGPPSVKLIDFGISHRASGKKHDGNVSGTPAYMAPEQIRGEPADRAVDLWALGVTLYELVAGDPPFNGADVTATLTAALTGHIPFPRAVRGLDGALWRTITDCLRVDLKQRTPSALALAEALDRRATTIRARESRPTIRTPEEARRDAARLENEHTKSSAPTAPDAARSTEPGADSLDNILFERLSRS